MAAIRSTDTCRRSLQQHFPNLDRELQNFKEMLEEYHKGDEKWSLPLSQLSEKICKRCQTIGNVLFDMEQHEEEGEAAEKLRVEVEKHERRLDLMLEAIGRVEHQFKSFKDDLESKKRIEHERKVHAAVNREGIGTSSGNPTRKQGTVKKELKPTTNLNAEMSSQEMRIFFQDYKSYRTASELDKESDDTQLAYLRLCLDPV